MRPCRRLELQTTTLWYHPSAAVRRRADGRPGLPGRDAGLRDLEPARALHARGRPRRRSVLRRRHDARRRAQPRAARARLRPPAAAARTCFRADARKLPLEDGKARLRVHGPAVLDARRVLAAPRSASASSTPSSRRYFEAMDAVFDEVERVLRDRRYLAVYCSRQLQEEARLRRHRRALLRDCSSGASGRSTTSPSCAATASSRSPHFHRAAEEENFFLRGFNHLLIFKKERPSGRSGVRLAREAARDAMARPAEIAGGKAPPRSAFLAPTPEVARRCSGWILVHETEAGRVAGGSSRPRPTWACTIRPRTRTAARRRAMPRCSAPPGHAYVYLIYGMHRCFNVVTARAGRRRGGARARARAASRASRSCARARGVARDRDLCQRAGEALSGAGHRRSSTTAPTCSASRLRLVVPAGGSARDVEIETGPRVGITRAAELALRFSVRGSPWASRP